MFLERVHSPGLAHISYLIGSGGLAAVIDPRRDCEVYVEIARRHGARIAHIFETHRNEDYVIGSPDLARLTGATIHHGAALQFGYGHAVTEGDAFDLGKLRLSVLETPGHTFESISLVAADLAFSEEPVAVFTGDALFIGDVGRTDFFPDQAEEVAGLLHDSIFGKLLPLGDHVQLYPAHGAGSVCGGGLAVREFSTLGYERRHNPALRLSEREAFIRHKLAERHHKPPYFKRMEEYNLNGAPPLTGLPELQPYSADAFAAAVTDGMMVLDVRSPEAFGGAHIPGSLALPLDMLSAYAGWVVPYDTPLGLVVDCEEQAESAVRQLVRIGYDAITALLEEGLHEWQTAGREFEGLPQVYAGEIQRRLEAKEEFTLLDVRDEGEFARGHLPGAVNIFLGELSERLDEVPSARPVTTFCGTGHRAIIGASILQRAGFERVENCLGSMRACAALGCEVRRGRPAD